MNDLITWLRACLDDDEKAAKKATPGPWVVDSYPSGDDAVFADGDLIAGYAANYPEAPIPMEPEDVAHIARHDPAAVLADVAAKREAIAYYEGIADDPAIGPGEYGTAAVMIRLLASAYRHRPGFKESWGV